MGASPQDGSEGLLTSSLYLRDFARRTIEVVLPHEARVDLDTVATPGRRIADRDAGVFTALQDDGDAEARAEAVIERFNPLFATYALGRLHDLDVLRCGQSADETVVVLR